MTKRPSHTPPSPPHKGATPGSEGFKPFRMTPRLAAGEYKPFVTIFDGDLMPSLEVDTRKPSPTVRKTVARPQRKKRGAATVGAPQNAKNAAQAMGYGQSSSHDGGMGHGKILNTKL